MKRYIATVTTKGQVTIPKDVREYLGLNHGDTVTFVINRSGDVMLKVPQYGTSMRWQVLLEHSILRWNSKKCSE